MREYTAEKGQQKTAHTVDALNPSEDQAGDLSKVERSCYSLLRASCYFKAQHVFKAAQHLQQWGAQEEYQRSVAYTSPRIPPG